VRDLGPGQVRVTVAAASVNGFDAAVAAGYLWDMIPHEFPVTAGRDSPARWRRSVPAVASGPVTGWPASSAG